MATDTDIINNVDVLLFTGAFRVSYLYPGHVTHDAHHFCSLAHCDTEYREPLLKRLRSLRRRVQSNGCVEGRYKIAAGA